VILAPLVILLKRVSVRYRLPKEPIRSSKEYVIHRIKGGRYAYEKYCALRQINLAADVGEVVGIIGRNGAGKSTLLKVVAGVIRPIQWDVPVNGSIAPLIEVGAGFDLGLIGRENIYLNGTILGCSNRAFDKQFDGIVNFPELGNFRNAHLRIYLRA
jgi:ABC-2 type transport system ATP-binding protein